MHKKRLTANQVHSRCKKNEQLKQLSSGKSDFSSQQNVYLRCFAIMISHNTYCDLEEIFGRICCIACVINEDDCIRCRSTYFCCIFSNFVFQQWIDYDFLILAKWRWKFHWTSEVTFFQAAFNIHLTFLLALHLWVHVQFRRPITILLAKWQWYDRLQIIWAMQILSKCFLTHDNKLCLNILQIHFICSSLYLLLNGEFSIHSQQNEMKTS